MFKSDKERQDHVDKTFADMRRRAQRRPLEDTEERVVCPKCGEFGGKRCRDEFEGKRRVAIWPHPERKRLHNRERAIDRVSAILKASEIEIPTASVRDVAGRIMDELHGKLENLRG